jgi:DNA polymerase-3 subunit gamma/tau
MEHIALYRKWRPQRFHELVGQEHISRTLLNAILQDRLAHAYLFCGPRGTGKTSTARLLAKALNCPEAQQGEPCNVCSSCTEITSGHSLDVVEIDAASNRGIDDARELREQVRFSASGGRYRVFIIDEFHMLTNEAFNALLKTLEEPPANVIFVLATTEPHKILQTIISRCQRFDFERIPLPQLVAHLQRVATAEDIGISPRALEAVARKAAGGLRDALSLLDQVNAMAAGHTQVADTLVYQTLGVIEEGGLLALVSAILHQHVEQVLENTRALLESGHEPSQILQELLQLLRHLMLAHLPPERMAALGVPGHLTGDIQQLGQGLRPSQIGALIERLIQTADRLHRSTQPEIWLEADLIHMALVRENTLLQRLEALEQRLSGGKLELVETPPVYQAPPRPQPPAAMAPLPTTPNPVVSEARVAPPPVMAPAPSEHTVAPAPEVTPPSAQQVLSEQDLATYWQKFLTLVEEQEKPLCAILSHGNLIHIDPARQVWRVRFTQLYNRHRERMDKEIKAGRLQPLVEAIMGAPYSLHTELQGSAATHTPSPAPPVAAAAPIAPSLPPPPPLANVAATLPPPIEPRPLPSPQPAPKLPAAAAPEKTMAMAAPPSIVPTSSIGETITATAQPRNKALNDAAELFKGKIIRTSG